MSVEARRVTKTEVWVGWENQVVNGVYPLRRFLGGSNHSAVFLTEFRAEGVPNAAIKLLPADALETEAQLVQWGTAATLSHPHLIRLFDVGRWQMSGRAYLFVVMEYADQTLAQFLPRRALNESETREMLLPALSALGFLHRNNLVQGQVKPTNLLVVDDQLKLASDTIRSSGNLSSGILRASLYDPPELKDGEIGPAGDIWGLGVTLVETLTQHPPAWPDPRSETVALATSIPPIFVDTVQRCLNQTPANRPTVAELEGQFNPAVHAHPITVVAAVEPVYEVAGEEPSPTPPPSPTPSSGRGVLVPAVLAVLVIALAVWVSRTIFESRGEVSAPPHSRVGVLTGAGSPLRAGAESQADAGSLSRAGAELQADGEPLSRVGAGSQADVEPLSGTGGSSQADADSRSRADKRGATRISRVTSAPSAQSGANSAADHTGAIARADGSGATATADAESRRSSDTNPGRDTHALAPAENVPVAHATATPSAAGTAAIASSAQQAPPAPEILGSVLHQRLPDIPRPIREKIRGHVSVTVRVLVDPAGNVVGEFFENPGPSRYFARMAGDAAGDWKFVPTDEHGSRVWLLRFEFTRADVTVRMVGTK